MNKRTNEEILKLAIEKAYGVNAEPMISEEYYCNIITWSVGYERHGAESVEQLIFSHDFAKAFWGEGEEYAHLPEWVYQLQQMVIQDDPIRYLEQFIDEKGGESA